ncbi:MAG: type II toxin-antitoxin system VapC family toxin [Methanosarcinales archaeon]|nr:MAG: type II toxin-antitoxin system VapC family toxin [Methanosarcinales archaeon]
MGWLEPLQGVVVGLDTAPLIYFIEENLDYLNIVRPFFAAVDRGDFRVVTSIVTLLEVLVHPFRHGNAMLAQQYREILLNANHIATVPMSCEITEEAARLRARHNVRTPDAIQMATAIQAGASFFLTNDSHLPAIPELRVLVLDELK